MAGNNLFGVNHGQGKGSVSRVRNIRTFKDNFEEIRWTGTVMCGKGRNRYVKRYGKTNTSDV
jgi:hypothetical protein